VAGRRKKEPLGSVLDKTRWEVDLLTSLLGSSAASTLVFRESKSDSPFRMKEGAGLLVWDDGMLDIRLSHDDLGLESSRSVEPSRIAVLGGCGPYLLDELARDCVSTLPEFEADSGSRRVFRLNREVDRRGRVVCSGVDEKVAGWETVRRAGTEEEVDIELGK
jgi:hypothetical protein